MWEIYDALVSLMPEDLKVEECLVGLHWTLIRSRCVGMAHTPFDGTGGFGASGASVTSGIGNQMTGMTVRRLAGYVKSWNPFEAALGLAAINSALNTPESADEFLGRPAAQQRNISVFSDYAEKLRGRRVAVIGRFPDLTPLQDICELSVLERRPGEGDLPDAACEYVLPGQDFVFLTATTLLNKTLPRLLQLSENAYTIMVGPSTPMTPLLFNFGIDALAGTVVLDTDSVWRAAQEGAARGIFGCGAQMVKVSKEEWQQNGSH
jgi:uncharacterized protein